MKKAVSMLLVLCISIMLAVPAYGAPALEITAKSAVLMDAASGAILWEQNAHEQLPNASTTKIMTALLVLEAGDLDSKVTVPADFVNVGESGISLSPGETHSVRDLFYALMLGSANDAAQVLAYHVAGSEEAFVAMMNNRVQELGLKDTHFVNCYGLHEEGQYSSAYDLSIITKAAMKYDFFNEVIITKEYELPWVGNEYDRVLYNTNKLLKNYEYADGVKTGYTSAAGSCLVSSATKDGRRLIAAVLNCDDMYAQSQSILEYGFANFYSRDLCAKGDVLATVKVTGGKQKTLEVATAESASIFTPKDVAKLQDPVIDVPETVNAPIAAGDVIGTVTYGDGLGNTVSVDLIAKESIKQHSFGLIWKQSWARIWQSLAVIFS